MKRRYLFLLLVWSYASTASAQFTLTADDLRALFGETLTSQSFFAENPDGVQALIAKDGANQTWDFTIFTYNSAGSGTVRYISPPAGTPGASDPEYTQANYVAAVEEPDSSYYTFFRIEDQAHFDLGFVYDDAQGQRFRAYYSEPFQSLAFPLTFGTTWADQGNYTTETPGVGTFTAQTAQSGTVDGYGTLITPAGTFECLRVVLQRDVTAAGITTTTFLYSWITREGVTASATRTEVFGFEIFSASYRVEGDPGGGPEPPAAAPTNLMPADNSDDQPTMLTLSWDALADAAEYDVEVATDAGFTAFFAQETTDQIGLTVTGLQEGTMYYWRVRGRNEAGAGPWSTVQSFSTASSASPPARVLLDSPPDNAVDQPTAVMMRWMTAEGATQYHLQVATQNDFSTLVYENMTLTATEQEVSGLAEGQTYFWRVRGLNDVGAGPFSETRQFSTVTSTAIAATSEDVPQTFRLYGAYPNPFNPSTTLRFDIANRSPVTLDIIDVTGRLVTRLVDTTLPAGTYAIPFDASVLSSGAYLYRLQAGTYADTRVMMLLK